MDESVETAKDIASSMVIVGIVFLLIMAAVFEKSKEDERLERLEAREELRYDVITIDDVLVTCASEHAYGFETSYQKDGVSHYNFKSTKINENCPKD